MNTQDIKQIGEKAVERLMADLEHGQSDTLKSYLETMGRFHKYSFYNCCLIYSQCPTASRVAGYQTWRTMGRQVVKGAKGIAILAPMVRKVKEETADTEERCLMGFRAVHVFDIASTVGEDLPEFAKVSGNPSEYLDRLTAFVSSEGITLSFSADIAPARGCSRGKEITLLPDLTPAESFAVLVHELAHSLLHFGDRRKETTKKIRETEAEAVAFVVSSAIGLDTNSSFSDYIQLYDGTKETLAQSLEHVQKTARSILDGIEGSSN